MEAFQTLVSRTAMGVRGFVFIKLCGVIISNQGKLSFS